MRWSSLLFKEYTLLHTFYTILRLLPHVWWDALVLIWLLEKLTGVSALLSSVVSRGCRSSDVWYEDSQAKEPEWSACTWWTDDETCLVALPSTWCMGTEVRDSGLVDEGRSLHATWEYFYVHRSWQLVDPEFSCNMINLWIFGVQTWQLFDLSIKIKSCARCSCRGEAFPGASSLAWWCDICYWTYLLDLSVI